jgi:hemoglobin-like flavoprotein
MSSDALLLRDTLELALAREAGFSARFYELLFAREPGLRSLFHRHSPGAQNKMFAQKLTAIVDHLEEPEWLERELAKLAGSHAAYGVTPEMYEPVGAALLETLREACGASWSDEAEQAWGRAYTALSRSIQDASPR